MIKITLSQGEIEWFKGYLWGFLTWPVMILFLLLISGCASSEPWTSKDTKHYIAYVAAASLDTYSTTRLISDWPNTEESNPVIVWTFGQRPSQDELIVGLIVTATANFFIARALPDKYRRKYLAAWTFGHSALAINNFRIYNDQEDVSPFLLPDANPIR